MNGPLCNWKVLKNRSNEIRTNEIRIRRELPVFLCQCSFDSNHFIVGFKDLPLVLLMIESEW